MNPNMLGTLMQIMRSGGDVREAVQQMANNNPALKQFLQITNGKNAGQLKTIAENMAKERNVSINDLLRQLGINNASKR